MQVELPRPGLNETGGCQTTTASAKSLMTESRRNPVSATEHASTPAVTATAAAVAIQAMLA